MIDSESLFVLTWLIVFLLVQFGEFSISNKSTCTEGAFAATKVQFLVLEMEFVEGNVISYVYLCLSACLLVCVCLSVCLCSCWLIITVSQKLADRF